MPASSPWSCILWDVDGTIVDASEGILSRLTATLEHFGRTPPRREDLTLWIGPPMFESFQKNTGMTPDEATEALHFYRSLGVNGGVETGARLFPGVAELIGELAAAGTPQATASSKPENQVVGLMQHFGLAPDLVAMVGASADEKALADKADIVREALRRLTAAGADVSHPVLIGDRRHDVEGGNAEGVPVVFVRWGFSTPDEAEGAYAAVADVDELRDLLLVTAPA